MHDVAIVGGGPAGLSAALTLGRVHRDVVVLDAGEGRNAPAEAVHNFLTNDGTPPDKLRSVGRDELARYPMVRIEQSTVRDARRGGTDGFDLELTEGRVVRARRLLLATGLSDRLADIEGLAPLWGRSVFHCPYCHGYEVSGRSIAVIGSGSERARLAVHLSRFSDDVVLCTNGPGELDRPMHDALAAFGIRVRQEPIRRIEGAGHQLKQIVFDEREPLAREAAFVKTTLSQRSDLAERLGCAIFPDGIVEVDEFGSTSVPGVYAAGDMARRATVPTPMASVVVAAASGNIAGSVIDQDLLSADAGLQPWR